MAHVAEELAYNRKWWWDPVDMEIYKELTQEMQRQIIAVSVATQAQMLKVQAEGVAQIGNILAGGQVAR
jgi:hypothetical protein